jgi:hypothetical protein
MFPDVGDRETFDQTLKITNISTSGVGTGWGPGPPQVVASALFLVAKCPFFREKKSLKLPFLA